jgi:hypothetical protein
MCGNFTVMHTHIPHVLPWHSSFPVYICTAVAVLYTSQQAWRSTIAQVPLTHIHSLQLTQRTHDMDKIASQQPCNKVHMCLGRHHAGIMPTVGNR